MQSIILYVVSPDDTWEFTPDGAEHYCYHVVNLPRGYYKKHDDNKQCYIECPNGAKIYEFIRCKRKDAFCPIIEYKYENRIRRVKLKIDEIATKKLIDDNLKKYK